MNTLLVEGEARYQELTRPDTGIPGNRAIWVGIFAEMTEFALGLTGQGDVFQLAYYYLTFNHLVHVSWGLLGMVWVLGRLATGAYTTENHRGLIAFASYWHATDLIWLMIFPLFYVLP